MAEITVKDVLERTYERINEYGWWGMDEHGGLRFSHKDDSHCRCVALHIDEALRDLGVRAAAVRVVLREQAAAAILGVVHVPATAADTNPTWWKLTKWNDVPTRHVATVKRAIKRAISKVAA